MDETGVLIGRTCNGVGFRSVTFSRGSEVRAVRNR